MKFKSDIEVQAGLKDSSGSIGTSGQILSSTSGNVSWVTPTVNTVARDVQNEVKAGVAINKGQAVYITGADGTNIIVGKASNTSEATSSKTLGLLNATVAVNGFADVVQIGRLSGLNTIGAVAGDPVWLGTNGNLIYGLANKPYAPSHLVFLGIVTRINSNNGEIFVNVQNGFELNEIHDVDLKTTVPVNGDILGFNGTLWVNKTIAQWLGYTPANANGTVNYVSKFTGATSLGNSQIFDNGTNVGIGTTTPSRKLSVIGLTYLSSDIFGGVNNGIFFSGDGSYGAGVYANNSGLDLLFNANGSEKMRINSAGNVGIGTTTPGVKLEVQGSAITDSAIRIKNTGSGGIAWDIYSTNSTFTQGAGKLLFYRPTDGNSATMTLDSAGNVGIGTTGPSYKLDVQSGQLRVLSGNSSNPALIIGEAGGPGTTNQGTLQFGDATSTFKIQAGNDYAGMIFTVGPERMRILSNGNIGIGTTSPSQKLTVSGGQTLLDQLQYTRAIDITGADLNSLVTAGFYNGPSLTNAPGGNGGWFWITVETYSGDNNWVHQTATTFGSGNTANEVYTRTRSSGTWTNWKRFIDWGDISGTTNYVSKFTGTSSLGNSSIFDNGSAVGIFTSAPGFVTPGRGVLSLNGSSNSLMEFQAGGAFKSYLYQSGTNFEIYDTNAILFAVSGSERMRIASSGNVGIGTSSPTFVTTGTTVLDVNGSTGAAIYLRANVAQGSYLRQTSNNLVIGNNTYGDVIYNTGFAEAMRITADRLVGIGTSAPSEKLDVYGVVRGLFSGNPGTGGITGKFLTFSPAPYGLTFRGYGTGTHSIQVQRESNDAEVFSLSLNPNGGNVGIGTTSPTRRLDIVSSNNDSFDAIAVRPNNQTQVLYLGWQGVATSLNFIVSTNGSEKMRVTTAGNIGVGTASPNSSAILHLRSTTQGFLPPVMRTGERDSIGSPAAGLMIFNEDDEVIQVYTNGSGWRTLAFL